MAAAPLRKPQPRPQQQPYTGDRFPDTFRDFFSKISEAEDDAAVAMLEDKLIPRAASADGRASGSGGAGHRSSFRSKALPPARRNPMSRRSFHRAPQRLDSASGGPASPAAARRRSSSIGVARMPPDLTRFLQAEGPGSPPGPASRPVSPRAARLPASPMSAPAPPPPPQPPPPASPSPQPPVSPQPGAHGDGRYRSRTSSMPAVPRNRPMLAQLARRGTGSGSGSGSAAGSTSAMAAAADEPPGEYYRVRSFSITPNGIFNLGDSFRSRRSHSVNSVDSAVSSRSEDSPGHRERLLSTVSSYEEAPDKVPKFKVAMLGAAGVGKTSLTCQFTTSEYICAYDTSLDEEFGQKTVSVMLDGREAELEIVDHAASEMSVESYCATYNPDVFVVVYSVIERKSLKAAEDILIFLWRGDYVASRGVILVGNKADLERKREVPLAVGRKLANTCGCKFIETSSGLDHNVDELLVGILAQVQLNPRRARDRHRPAGPGPDRHRGKGGSGRRILRHLMGFKRKSRSCENLLVL